MNHQQGAAVRRKADGRPGIVRNAWTQDDGSRRVFVQASDRAGEFLSGGMLGEPDSAYEAADAADYTVTLDCRPVPAQAGHIRGLPLMTLDAALALVTQRWIAGHASLGRIVRVSDLTEIRNH